jgi:hypothetical protein
MAVKTTLQAAMQCLDDQPEKRSGPLLPTIARFEAALERIPLCQVSRRIGFARIAHACSGQLTPSHTGRSDRKA